jgi:putative DNA primase/helicase
MSSVPRDLLRVGSSDGPGGPAEFAPDADGEISRLAGLGKFEYERERRNIARRLEVRALALDRWVAAKRGQSDDRGKQGHALSLPEPPPWPEQVTGVDLLDRLSTIIRGHVVMADHAAETTALWVVHTYLLDCFGISPRLAITSPERGCGKTTLMDILSHLVMRPLPVANATASAVFRVVEIQRPTLLIDEADTFLSESDELRGILNSGHRQGGAVIRAVGESLEPRSFSTYSACAIALIGKLPPTLADRSVPIELRRRRVDEIIEPFRFDRTEPLDQLASQIARWTRDNAARVRGAEPTIPAGVLNRTADNWRPLLAISDIVGGAWPARARNAAQCFVTAGEDEPSTGVALLADIRAHCCPAIS